eukprot:Polyplicarium_translucidae@DN1425_c0_g1_i1.p2
MMGVPFSRSHLPDFPPIDSTSQVIEEIAAPLTAADGPDSYPVPPPFFVTPPPLHAVVDEVIKRCQMDFRRQLFSNIVCVGAGAAIPGLVNRLEAEVAAICVRRSEALTSRTGHRPQDIVVQAIRSDDLQFPRLGSWRGVSTVAANPSFSSSLVTRNEWNERGPDQLIFGGRFGAFRP